jgi:hypothetical protein
MSSSVSHTIMWTKARKPFHGMEIQFLRTTGILYFTDPKPMDHCVFYVRRRG